MTRVIPARPAFSRKTVVLIVKIASQAINTTVAAVALAPLVLLSAGAIAAAISHHDRTAQLLGAFAVGGIIALVGGVLVLRPAFRRLTRGYRWKTAEYIYRIALDNPSVHTQTVKVTLTAISPWFRVFENRYHWTGRGDEGQIRLKSPRGSLFGPVAANGWNYYYVHLHQALDVGETAEIEIEQTLIDEDHRFQPHLSKTVIEPIDSLTLRVIFPRDLFPKRINAYVGYPPPIERREVLTPTLNAEAGEARLDISRPIYGRRYWLEWEPTGGDP